MCKWLSGKEWSVGVDVIQEFSGGDRSGMKYAKSFPLENDEGEGGRSHKGYRKKKNTEISVSCVNILIVQ